MLKTISQQTRSMRILIVDNDPERKKTYNQMFDENINVTYQPIQLIYGLSKTLKSRKFNILIIYLEFIDNDKVNFLDRIKLENPDVRIVLITRLSGDIFKWNNIKMDDYLFTPFSTEDFTATMQNII